MTDNKYADIYGALNLLDAAVQRGNADDVLEGIETWLAEEDQDTPTFRETLAQGIQDAVSHAITIDNGKRTITIVTGDDALLRFEWHAEDGPGQALAQAASIAVNNALAGG